MMMRDEERIGAGKIPDSLLHHSQSLWLREIESEREML